MQFGESADWRDEDLYAIGAQPPIGRQARGRRVPWIRISLTSVAFIAIIAIYSPDRDSRNNAVIHSLLGEPPQLLAPPSPWRDLSEGGLAIALQDERLAGLPLVYAARAHDDGTLQDIIEVGRFRSNAAYFRVLIERRPGDHTSRSFFVDLALNAAQAGLAVARTRPDEALDTSEGRVELARVWLENGSQRDCLAYRSVNLGDLIQDFGIKQFGWLCAPGLTRADLACAIDGLQLRHRETGLRLRGPVMAESPKVSACTHAPDLDVLSEMPPEETTASLGGQSPPQLPLPPRRPSER
jgi:hypothetical protein